MSEKWGSAHRKFYIEAKAIELIAHQIDVLIKNQVKRSSSSTHPLTDLEVQKLAYCDEELKNNLRNPPSLIELAKKGGLSPYRLKNRFIQQFGNTPLRLLGELRMLKAKELLEESVLNVSQVAMDVGYCSLGTFSNAFFHKFGLRPSAFKK